MNLVIDAKWHGKGSPFTIHHQSVRQCVRSPSACTQMFPTHNTLKIVGARLCSSESDGVDKKAVIDK